MAKILIAGGTGLVGTRLTHFLQLAGHEVGILSRSPKAQSDIRYFKWNPMQGEMDTEAIEFADYVVNLAGAGIADRPWTSSRKKLIIDSRVDSNRARRHRLLHSDQ